MSVGSQARGLQSLAASFAGEFHPPRFLLARPLEKPAVHSVPGSFLLWNQHDFAAARRDLCVGFGSIL